MNFVPCWLIGCLQFSNQIYGKSLCSNQLATCTIMVKAAEVSGCLVHNEMRVLNVQKNMNKEGQLLDPRGKPFQLALSKEHPEEHRAHGFEDDLLIPFAQHFDSVCYKYLFTDARSYGVTTACPQVPLFSDCEVLFSQMHDSNSENYLVYREFMSWWTDVLARCLLSAHTIYFNLAGYTKERIQVITKRCQQLLDSSKETIALNYEFIEYQIVPHLIFNVPWTSEEKQVLKTAQGDYPGFTDWDLSVILNDASLLHRTHFYNVKHVTQLDSTKELTSAELEDVFGIIKNKGQ